jgi:rare lipoprotein A
MIMRFRRFGAHSVVAAALAVLPTSTPVQAVQFEDAGRLQSLTETVATLDETVTVAPAEEPAAVYEAAGRGEASYYGHELAGNRTASGERFNPNGLTAAHRSLPLGTKLRVTNLANGKSVIVRVNDRGPFVRSRLIDVSLGAAHKISMVRAGKAQVSLEIVRNQA